MNDGEVEGGGARGFQRWIRRIVREQEKEEEEEKEEDDDDAVWIALVACHAGVCCCTLRGYRASSMHRPRGATRCCAARCFTVKQKGGGVGGGKARGRRRRSGPCEARGHSRLCKPYRSAHYLAARRLSNNIMVQRASAAHKRRSRCTGHAVRMHTYAPGYSRELYVVHAGSWGARERERVRTGWGGKR